MNKFIILRANLCYNAGMIIGHGDQAVNMKIKRKEFKRRAIPYVVEINETT
jgi:hypothetical protein